MKHFTELFQTLDTTSKTNAKVAALKQYFRLAAPEDAVWALFYLTGRRLKRAVKIKTLRQAARELANIPQWLFEESYHIVGDTAETIALLLPPAEKSQSRKLSDWIEKVVIPLREMDEQQQIETLKHAWMMLRDSERYLWNKLLTGNLRIGVSQLLVLRALSELFEVDSHILARRLMGDWQPAVSFWEKLQDKASELETQATAYPFMLAHPLTDAANALGDLEHWLVEWKWDGIRAQMIVHEHGLDIWSRGEELLTASFPEFKEVSLPVGSILDGEILAWKAGQVLPFAYLQKRITRKKLTRSMLEEIPCIFLAFDLLQLAEQNVMQAPLGKRRELLETEIVFSDRLHLSSRIQAGSWQQLTELQQRARENKTEGLMLKHLASRYEMGRKRGLWWKWKIEPMTVDAVLIQAQRGHGRRANLYSDYTFGVWRSDQLVPFAKAYSGLSDTELRQVDRFVKRNTLERYGPVALVKPELVFEIAFEGIQASKRHKSGVAVRFPRILRARTDKQADQADHIEALYELLKLYE